MPVLASFIISDVPTRRVHWLGSSLDDLRSFPDGVQDVMGYALYLAQCDERHRAAKPLRGYLRGLMEVSDSYEGNAYRVVYTTKFPGALYVVHAFQKKSTRGAATPKREVDMMRQRYRLAQEHHHKVRE